MLNIIEFVLNFPFNYCLIIIVTGKKEEHH